jgi:hypothetical protein
MNADRSIPFTSRRHEIEDARIERCTCGAWVYGEHDCTTCGLSWIGRLKAIAQIGPNRRERRTA